jgi:hypothetical protein
LRSLLCVYEIGSSNSKHSSNEGRLALTKKDNHLVFVTANTESSSNGMEKLPSLSRGQLLINFCSFHYRFVTASLPEGLTTQLVARLSAQFSFAVWQVAFFVLRLEAMRRQDRASTFPSVVALFHNGPSRQAHAGAGVPEIPG